MTTEKANIASITLVAPLSHIPDTPHLKRMADTVNWLRSEGAQSATWDGDVFGVWTIHSNGLCRSHELLPIPGGAVKHTVRVPA